MRKGFKNFCNGDASTSTLNQHHHQTDPSSCMVTQSLADDSPYLNDDSKMREENRQPTLEEMILQLDLEEKMMARRAKLDEYGEIQHHRMSCVNSSDILRSARNALNQYPRFSLDGKDAMYRSSFRNLGRPISSAGVRRKGFYKDGLDSEVEKSRLRLPAKLAGESVVWCKPGVVGKLMGLEAMPMPVNFRNGTNTSTSSNKERLSCMIKRQNMRRRAERHEMERGTSGGCGRIKRGGMNIGNNNKTTMNGVSSNSCSRKGEHCVRVFKQPHVAVELPNDDAGWPMRRFF